MLQIKNLHAYYGESHIIKGVSLELNKKETVCILGRNGMGKTTFMKAVIGLLKPKEGQIFLENEDITMFEPFEKVKRKIAYVPQGREIFPYLTVQENLEVALEASNKKVIPDFIFELFPVLKDMLNRKGGNLSGGQQQQLAIARALVSDPKIILLDEPTEGIQPSIIEEIAKVLNILKKEKGISILLTEQVLNFALETSDRFYIIEKGQFVHETTKEQADVQKLKAFLTF
ncbi:urea ABC transporter, ATP-binding protein UrtE [Thermodesulfatator indicus DSM 15286]|uniref:Urea ABC transporter, ATP-binding protein UrtE n=1 Tax=Thermodesulfatator indicus (strain DSM 15286 / JCM 11887 / CIR29812) TaxID=667014 RepID=F8A822_THEID|nr:urea ABC transporter ATP-binding subunit UrtE [Thermodesulfatator indicus]AEH45015.1 urea ABC transporter, ATP-binding protein UrtE [Thermodesulfatator indicus DSM 15286]